MSFPSHAAHAARGEFLDRFTEKLLVEFHGTLTVEQITEMWNNVYSQSETSEQLTFDNAYRFALCVSEATTGSNVETVMNIWNDVMLPIDIIAENIELFSGGTVKSCHVHEAWEHACSTTESEEERYQVFAQNIEKISQGNVRVDDVESLWE